jgi:NAD(P)-dependent dehydrogenase (short-subunit alcohol dehydrogenase family)
MPTIAGQSGAGFDAARAKASRPGLAKAAPFRDAQRRNGKKGSDVSKILVIGAAGLIGARVVEALGEDRCIRASRNSGERVDISDPKSLAALFERVGELDGVVCTGGAARFKPWDQLTDEDWAFSLANKLLGQVNVVRYGVKTVRPGGAITLTTGLAAQYPSPGSAIITAVNAAVEAFVRAAAAEPSISVRVNAVSPGWVAETLQAMGRDPAGGIPAADVAQVFVRQLRDGPSGSVAPSARG